MRIKYFRWGIFSIFIFLALYLFYLQIIHGRSYRQLSRHNSIRIIPEEGARGRILDRNANVLVDNSLSYDVYILTQDIKDKDEVFMKLSSLLGIPEQDIRKRFSLQNNPPFAPRVVAKDIDRKKAIKIEMHNLDLPNVIIHARPKRHYPYASLAAHILGYLGEIDYWRLSKLQDYGYKIKDIVGYGGVEEWYDYYLRSYAGGLQVEVDHRGRFNRTLGFRYPLNGKDIQLTIDLNLQRIAEESLGMNKGAVILMDPSTGEILAMANYPDFNPDISSQGDTTLEKLFKSKGAPLLNRSISGLYPPGSVFKIVTALAGLSSGKINLSTTFYCPGSLHVGRREFLCWDTHGQQNLLQAIIHSCNVFFYRIGLVIGPQNLYEYAVRLGLGRPTGVDLPSESGGLIPSPFWRRLKRQRPWFDGDTANFSIGQGEVLTTPLQLTRLLAVLANGGYLITPYIVKSIDGKDVSLNRRKIYTVPLKTDLINIVRRALKGVVSDSSGTANILNMKEVSIAGKTGTAQAPPHQPHSWFVGFFPYKNPKFVICVFLEHGGSSHYASLVARKIIEKMIEEKLL